MTLSRHQAQHAQSTNGDGSAAHTIANLSRTLEKAVMIKFSGEL